MNEILTFSCIIEHRAFKKTSTPFKTQETISMFMMIFTRKSRLCPLSEESSKEFACWIHWQKVWVVNLPLGDLHCRGHKTNKCPLTYHLLLTGMQRAGVHSMENRHCSVDSSYSFSISVTAVCCLMALSACKMACTCTSKTAKSMQGDPTHSERGKIPYISPIKPVFFRIELQKLPVSQYFNTGF